MKPTPLILGVLLAVGSFAFAYHQAHTVSVGRVVSFTVSDNSYFGNWMKDQWPLAIAVPIVLIVGGAALSMKK